MRQQIIGQKNHCVKALLWLASSYFGRRFDNSSLIAQLCVRARYMLNLRKTHIHLTIFILKCFTRYLIGGYSLLTAMIELGFSLSEARLLHS